MRKPIILIILSFLLINSVFGQYGYSLQEDQKKVTIPFSVYNNLVVVPLILNSRLPLKFILDTGVRNAILTEKTYTDILNIPYARKFVIRGVGGEQLIEAYLATSISLALPGINGSGQTLLILDEDLIELRNFMGTDVHGMLGYELFSRFVVEINYKKRLLTLYDPEFFKPHKRFTVIPMEVEDTKPFIYSTITFDDNSTINARLLVDTGASHGLMLDPASSEDVVVSEPTIDAVIGRGLGGTVEGQIGRIEQMAISEEIVFDDPIATFPYPNSYMDSLINSKVVRNGSIGGSILSRFTLIFDYPNEQLYLKKNSDFNEPFYYNLSGMTIKAIGAQLNNFEIEEVREGSDAYSKGLRTGDLILSINGLSVKDMSLDLVNGYLNSKPNRRVTLMVSRQGDHKRISFKLNSAI